MPALGLANPLIDDARTSAQAGDHALAIRLFERALSQDPALYDNAQVIADYNAARARLSYETGLVLHRAGEFEAAAAQFFEAIAADDSLGVAYAALTDAQVAGARDRLERAVSAATEGDLRTAQEHLHAAVILDGENNAVNEALASIDNAEQYLTQDQQAQLERADALADERQWDLASQSLRALLEEAPLCLPALSAVHRTDHFQARATEFADRGAALLLQGRLEPAMEEYASAVAIWPYHPSAADELEQLEANVRRARSLGDQAQQAAEAGEMERALDLSRQSLEIDRSSQVARRTLNTAQRGLADVMVANGDAHLEEGELAKAHAAYAAALERIHGYPSARRGMASVYLAEGQSMEADDRDGAALLTYLAGFEHDRRVMNDALTQVQDAVLNQSASSYAMTLPNYDPVVGVSDDILGAVLARQPGVSFLNQAIVDDARFEVNVAITDSDVTLRRTRNSGSSYFNTNGYATSEAQWEKRGHVNCTIIITDRVTGEEVDRWDANRWTTHRDSQQYVVGSTWRRSYWTLPSDTEVASRLAGDLADDIWPDIARKLTLAYARNLMDESRAARDAGNAAEALELRVRATLLAGQVNDREGQSEMRRLARENDVFSE